MGWGQREDQLVDQVHPCACKQTHTCSRQGDGNQFYFCKAKGEGTSTFSRGAHSTAPFPLSVFLPPTRVTERGAPSFTALSAMRTGCLFCALLGPRPWISAWHAHSRSSVTTVSQSIHLCQRLWKGHGITRGFHLAIFKQPYFRGAGKPETVKALGRKNNPLTVRHHALVQQPATSDFLFARIF